MKMLAAVVTVVTVGVAAAVVVTVGVAAAAAAVTVGLVGLTDLVPRGLKRVTLHRNLIC